MSKTTMKAVVFKGTLDVKIEDRPIPKIIDQTDIIIKVHYSALCGRCDRNPPSHVQRLIHPAASFMSSVDINPAKQTSSW